ncbi:MAG: hypothetical protein AAB495_01515 [Patescibacteria group bacterium]
MGSEKEKFGIKYSYMSDRGIFRYLDCLSLTEEELNDPESIILDLGSGTEQNFAKEARLLGLKSTVISMDPRLALNEKEDLSMPHSDKEARIRGRDNPEPKTIAAIGGALPFKDGSIKKIYALYSVPYYLNDKEAIEKNLCEMIRVLSPHGTAKVFPIPPEQERLVGEALDKKSDQVKYSLIFNSEYMGMLLVITKEESTKGTSADKR